ncbi:hypothetical protein ACQ4LF_06370, partial [Aeromonas salmonicida]
MDLQQDGEELKRGLKNRHIQLIALGGAIGTGLFLGIAQTIKMAGPSVLLGYAIGCLLYTDLQQAGGERRRGRKNRHIQLIALGGAIG